VGKCSVDHILEEDLTGKSVADVLVVNEAGWLTGIRGIATFSDAAVQTASRPAAKYSTKRFHYS